MSPTSPPAPHSHDVSPSSSRRPALRSVSGRSVSDTIKQYEARASSSPPSDFAPGRDSPSRMIRRPSGIPSRVGGVTSPPRSTPRQPHENGGMAREGSLEGNVEAGPSRVRPNGTAIGLGAPIGLRSSAQPQSQSNGLTSPPRTRQSRPSTLSSGIPRALPQSASLPRNLSAGASPVPFPSHSTASRPSPANTNASLPRSASDSLSRLSRSSKPSRPSSEAGPSRLPSPTKTTHPVVAISVSRPSPDKRLPLLRKRSSKSDLAGSALRSPTSPTSHTSGIPLPANPRRPSYRSTSSSISSQGSAPSNYYSPGSFSPQKSPFNFPMVLEAELNPTRAASSPMDRGISSRSRGSKDRVVELSSPPPSSRAPSRASQGSPGSASRAIPRPDTRESPRRSSQQHVTRTSVDIPRRTSSTSQPSSPVIGLSQSPPTISPRQSSMSNAQKQERSSPVRSGGKDVDMLGRAFKVVDIERSPSRPSLHSRRSSTSSASRRTDLTFPPKSAASPAAPDSPRRTPTTRSKDNASPSSTRQAPFTSPKVTPRSGANGSPRKSPGLTINPPPPPLLSRLSSSASQPSPPVPAKSPLRGLSQQGSGQSSPIGNPHATRAGSTSDEVTRANAGTPTSAIERVKRMSEVDADKRTPPFKTPNEGLIQPSTASGPPSQLLETPVDEIRFTALTVPSMYSQDSAPPSATSWALSEATAMSGDSWRSDVGTEGPRRLDSVSWGQKRSLQNGLIAEDHRARRSSSLPRLTMPYGNDKMLPNLPTDTPSTTTTNNSSLVSNNASSGHTPVSPTESRREPVKSPSLPVIRKDPGVLRQRSKTSNGLLPAATLREDDGLPALRPLLPTSPSVVMSKRSHLIREIANTERAYAKDLALIRDAYMYRFLRPVSNHSAQTNGDSSISPGAISDHSRRSSIYTYQTAETKRSSGYESLSSSWVVPHQTVTSPVAKSPGDALGQTGPGSGYFTSTARTSTTSLHATPQPSPRKGSSRSSVHGGTTSMPPPVGKPLAPADLKTVFLNLDQLAGAADELATAFEHAMGEDDLGPTASSRAGEAGTDRLGQVFTTTLPRLRPMYIFYCSRQSQASQRLSQLQADPAHAAYLADCWTQIKARTHAWNLDSMLIKPVQRITKYPMLFDDLLANTTPVHPDYFAIRTAAQMSKAVAMEIDEAKRRQDVVSNAIGSGVNGPSTGARNDKQPTSKLLGLKRFRNKDKDKDKDKDNLKAISSSSTLASLTKSASALDLATPPPIPESSMTQLKDLVNKVDELDHAVRNVGKEVVFWTAAAKEVCVAQDGLVRVWLRVVQLDPTDLADRRLLEFRRAVECFVSEAWAELNEEIKTSIIPVLGKLLESSLNPRKVISKRDAKLIDYGRYQALRASRRPIDRTTIQSANEFVALHTQLIEELPAFLEGYLRILDMVLVAFSRAQSKYFAGIKQKVAEFAGNWIEPPPTPLLPSDTGSGSADPPGGLGAADVESARGIVKAWHEAWAPYAEAMDHFQCTRPARGIPRVATFNNTPSAKPSSRPVSRANTSNRGSGTGTSSPHPLLRHSASTASQISLADLARAGSPIPSRTQAQNRIRSSSLRSLTAPTINLTAPSSPSLEREKEREKEKGPSRFSLLRRSNSKNQVSRDGIKEGPRRPPLSPRDSGLRPLSVGMIPDDESASSRLSWGLPKISQENRIFEGIGLSPTKSQGSFMSTSSLYQQSMRATSDPTPTPTPDDRTYDPSRHPFAAAAPAAATATTRDAHAHANDSQISLASNATSAGLGFAFDNLDGVERAIAIDRNDRVELPDTSPVIPRFPDSPQMPQIPQVAQVAQVPEPNGYTGRYTGDGYEVDRTPTRMGRGRDTDAAAGWRNESVLYQCACVADFEPSEWGNKRYRGLRFLSMVSGDLIDVFHEVGRIDELASFPYPQVGVDNDGVLVGRAEDGQIGLVICSFLEPLRD